MRASWIRMTEKAGKCSRSSGACRGGGDSCVVSVWSSVVVSIDYLAVVVVHVSAHEMRNCCKSHLASFQGCQCFSCGIAHSYCQSKE